MINIDSLIGTINNQILNIMSADGLNIIDYKIIWDIPYIARAIILILSLWFMFKCILALIYKVGGGTN